MAQRNAYSGTGRQAGRRSGSPEKRRRDVGVRSANVLQKRAQEAPAAGDAGDGLAETTDSSQGVRWTPPQPRQGRPNSRDDGFVSRGRGGRLLGPAKKGRMRLGRIISSLRHRPRERRRSLRGPIMVGSTRAQQLETAPPDSKGLDPGSANTWRVSLRNAF